jgi:hypothetical protein
MLRASQMIYHQSPSLPEIIDLYPEDNHRCVGWAKSQGRRCRNLTNAQNRRKACALLDKGTRKLETGERRIDDLLGEIAPLLLCWRHGSDACSVVGQWKTSVDRFIHLAIEPPRGAVRPSNASRTLASYRRSEGSSETREPSTRNPRQHSSRITPPATLPGYESEVEQMRNDLHSISLQLHEVMEALGVVSVNNSAPVPSPNRARRDVRSQSASDGSATTLPSPTAAAPAQRRTTQASEVRGTTRSRPATRRDIEGDCGICFMPLQMHEDKISDDEHSSDEGDDLVWCKAQCGVNYHKTCIDKWTAMCLTQEREPTCPLCRARWTT